MGVLVIKSREKSELSVYILSVFCKTTLSRDFFGKVPVGVLACHKKRTDFG